LEIPLLKEIEKIHKIRIQQSEYVVEYDKMWAYGNLRLNRSTDKKWWKPQTPKRQSFTKTYNKLYPSDEQKALRGENNYRSNPNHKQHERRPGRSTMTDKSLGSPSIWTHKPSSGGGFRGVGKPRHR
jgi:hypothetical protein